VESPLDAEKIDGQTCQDDVRHFAEIYDTAAITDLDRLRFAIRFL
jgi:hypothetical protein